MERNRNDCASIDAAGRYGHARRWRLSQGAAFAQPRHDYYHHHHHYRYYQYYHHHHRHYWGGPRVIRSNPVPDTPHNRDRFGGPMSHGGRDTAPVGN